MAWLKQLTIVINHGHHWFKLSIKTLASSVGLRWAKACHQPTMKSAGTMKLTKPKQIGRKTIKNVSGNMAPFFRASGYLCQLKYTLLSQEMGKRWQKAKMTPGEASSVDSTSINITFYPISRKTLKSILNYCRLAIRFCFVHFCYLAHYY